MNLKPKVLHCAMHSPQYSSEGITKGFEQNGYEVIQFNWQPERFSNGIDGMRRKLLFMAEANMPDLIFLHIQVPDVLDIETVKKLQQISPVVNYTFDVRNPDKSQWLYDIAPHITLSCFACQEDIDYCRSIGVNNVCLIQSSADYDIYKKLPLNEERKGVVFIGNNHLNTNLEFPLAQERFDMVELLEKAFPNDFKCYGMKWKQSQYINPQDEINIYNRSLISVCQNNFDRVGYSSDRLFRSMACGTMVLTKYVKGLEKLFERGVHLDWWENFTELHWLISNYLKDSDEAKAIGESGRIFVIENHTWSNRIAEVKYHVSKILNVIPLDEMKKGLPDYWKPYGSNDDLIEIPNNRNNYQ